MTKTIAVLQNGIVNITPPPGKKIRLIAARFGVSAVTDGDSIVINFARLDVRQAGSASGPLVAITSVVLAGIGLGNTEQMTDKTDPVTGLVTYKQAGDTVTMGLPDIWWEQETRIIVETVNATIDDGLLVYQEE